MANKIKPYWKRRKYFRDPIAKTPSSRRRIDMLLSASRQRLFIYPGRRTTGSNPAVVAHGDKDLLWLVERGLLRIARVAVGEVWARDLKHPAAIRHTRVAITEAGYTALFTEDLGVTRPMPRSERREKRARHV